MKRAAMSYGLLAAALLVCLAARPARADEATGQPHVVLIGIDKYNDPQIKPREHAEADAKALYDLFKNKKYLGADDDHIKLLLGSEDKDRNAQTATRKNILKELKWLAKSAKDKDLVILAFFMQGAPLGERAAYLTTDSTFKDRKKDALTSEEVQAALNDVKSQRFVVLLDVNFNGFDAGNEPRPDPNLSGFFREFLGKDDDNDVSRVILMANNGLKPSVNLVKHGAFAKTVLDGLHGKADKAGYEPDGLITVEELVKFVRKELPDLNRKHGKNDDEKGQTPIILEGQIDSFIVGYNPPAHEKAQQQLKAFQAVAQKEQMPKDLVEEGTHLLERMPKLEGKQQMRKAYQKLAENQINFAQFQTERKNLLELAKLSPKELTDYAKVVLSATHKVKEDYVGDTNQGELVDWAIRAMYKKAHETVPSALEENLKKAKTMTEAQLVRLLTDARGDLGKREDLAKGKDVTFSLHGMLTKLDRHTDYYDPEMVEALEKEIQGNFKGIGVQIRKNNTHDALEIVTPLKDSPAYKAGIYQGDLITKIVRVVDDNGVPLTQPEVISTKGMTTEEAVKKIAGKEGTKIRLVISRDGVEKEFDIIRGTIEMESVLGAKRNKDDSWDFWVDPEAKICYVRLTQFSTNTFRDLNQVMKQLHQVGIKGFILDLRFNPGGLLDSAVKISDLFIDDGMIVTIKKRNGPWTSYVGKSDGSYLTFPMVCLVNGYSASGSEIVSACLQDHGRAIIMGTRSYGKGSVQTLNPFMTPDGTGILKLTTATFWRPSGKNLNKASTKGKEEDEWGVKPNKGFELKLPPKELADLQEYMRWHEIIHRPDAPKKQTELSKFHDRQLEMAVNYLKAQIQTAKNKGKAAVGQ